MVSGRFRNGAMGDVVPHARLRVKTAEFGPEKLPPLMHRPLWFLGLSEMGCNTRTSREVTHPSTLNCGVLMGSGALVLPSVRPWGPHDFLTVFFSGKCIEVNGVKKASKTT
ncbi:hypothetical protein YC2023_051312 [Brassica napus]